LDLRRSFHDNGRVVFFSSLILISAAIVSILIEPGMALGQNSEEVTATPTPEGGTDTPWPAYRDSEYGVTIAYPPDWEVVERDEGSIVVFFSPSASLPENENTAVGHLALYADTQPGILELSSYSETLVAGYTDQLEGFRLLDTKSRTLAGGEAQQIIFDAIDASGAFRALDVWTLRNNVAYHAVYYSPADDFELELNTVTTMLDSLEIVSASLDRPIVGGIYELPSLGLQIHLPDDWSGYVIHEGNSTFAFVSPAEIQGSPSGADDKGNFAVMFIYTDPEERFEIQREWAAYGCESPTDGSVVIVNQVKTIETTVACTDAQIRQLKVYGFASSDNGFYIGFGSSSDEASEAYLSDFEESLRSIQLLEPGDPAELGQYARIGALASTIHPVWVGENAYDFYIASTTQVGNVVLDEEQNQLAFELEAGQEAEGEIYFRPSYFLYGPYVVTVDGEVVEQGVELVQDGDAYYLSITYDGGLDHIVTVTGTNVVPEFDVHLSILLAALVAGTVLAARSKLLGRGLERSTDTAILE